MNKEEYEKELALKDEEYNILKVTSEQIEEEQSRKIYELELKINEALKMIDECACYVEQDKECKCGFSSMAMTKLRGILKEEQ